jgi:hypothetical protein
VDVEKFERGAEDLRLDICTESSSSEDLMSISRANRVGMGNPPFGRD